MKALIKKLLPAFVISWYHFLLAFFGALIYRFPSKKLKVVGVTGTNGKTTTVQMTAKVLEAGGYKVASLSSIRFRIGDKEKPNILKMTMPGRFKIHKFLRDAVSQGCQYAVLEVSSEGIKQYRHKFIDFEVAVFTNLSPEHIESHGGFENYRKAKMKLFQATKNIHVINQDDQNSKYFLDIKAKKIYTYGMKGGEVNINNTKFNLSLMGDFNKYNALAAITVGISQGISKEKCERAVEEVKDIPGRMEIVVKDPFKVIVDYAVTPDALEGLYKTIKRDLNPNNLVCVFGACGGGRDKWRRPVLGKIAEQYCNKVILTNEDPYDENPQKILDQIAEGMRKEPKEIMDRRQAIAEALRVSGPGDVVAISGKGSELWLAVAKGKKIPWSDRNVVKEEFAKRKG